MTNLERSARDAVANRSRMRVHGLYGWCLVKAEKMDALESALKELDAPAVPTAVDLTLARPGDVCRLRDGTESVFYGRTPLTRGAQYASEFPFETNWDEQYRRDGSFSSVRGRVSTYDIIAVFGQRDGRLICGVDTERTVIGEQ